MSTNLVPDELDYVRSEIGKKKSFAGAVGGGTRVIVIAHSDLGPGGIIPRE